MSGNPVRLDQPGAPGLHEAPTFVTRLSTALERNQMTRSDLARAVWGEMTDTRGRVVARNRDRITQYLSGKSVPEPKNRAKLADALGVSEEWLFPDLLINAFEREPAEIAMHAVKGHSGQVVLRLNKIVTLEVAAEIIGILTRAEAATH